MIYGTPILRVEHDQTDQVGLRRLVLSKMWQASRGSLSIEALDAEEPSPPEVPGGLGLIGRSRTSSGGVIRTAWTYEGINGNGKDVTFKGRGVSQHYGFDPGFSEAPIQRHPKLRTAGGLLETYEGEALDTEIIWPPYLSGKKSSGVSGSAKNSSAQVNPMYGQDTYFTFQGGIYWYRYMARDESEIPDIIGRLFIGGLPGRPPRVSGRNWLCAGVPFQRRGPNAIEVMEHYWLSDDGGWPKAIYSNGGGKTDATSGLQTGGLTTGHL
jgi:hypothetical protein